MTAIVFFGVLWCAFIGIAAYMVLRNQ